MKKRIIALLFTAVVLLTACQPTPDETVVIGKNNNNLNSIIGSTPAPTIKTEDIQEKETWQEELNGKNVTININAEILFPNAAQIPVVEVAPQYFTEEDAQKAITVFFKDCEVYDKPVYTKEVIEAQIVTLKKELTDIQNGTIEGDIDDIKKQIEYYTELLKTAHSEDDVPQTLNHLSFKEQNEREVINVSTNIGDDRTPSELMVIRDKDSYESALYFSNFPDNLSRTSTTENNMEMTVDQAIDLAQSTMSNLGITDMILSEANTIGSKQEQAYELSFYKSINGIRISDYQTHMMIEPEEGESVYAPFLKPEIATIYINDSGVLEFYCTNPLEIGEIINENVRVMSFDEIKNIFKDQVFYNYYADEDYPITINVNRIDFGYFIQSVKDQDGIFRAIPVWDFLASEDEYEGDSSTYSVLTINAIDGSIINRSLGY